MPRYIKASEAIKLSGLTSSTFHRWAEQGKIKKYFPTNESARALYDEGEMKRLREEQGEVPGEYQIDWLGIGDLGALFNLEINIYGDETGDPRIVKNWIRRNPLLCKAIFNKQDRLELWGAVFMLPIVDEATMVKLCSHEIRDIELDPDTQIRTYNDPGTFDLYTASVIMREDKRYLLTELVKSYFEWWADQAPQKKIGRIWGRAISAEGELLAIRLQASPLDWLPGKVYRLDLSVPRRLPLIRDFQQKVKAKEEG